MEKDVSTTIASQKKLKYGNTIMVFAIRPNELLHSEFLLIMATFPFLA